MKLITKIVVVAAPNKNVATSRFERLDLARRGATYNTSPGIMKKYCDFNSSASVRLSITTSEPPGV
jgi:hypothetical protein